MKTNRTNYRLRGKKNTTNSKLNGIEQSTLDTFIENKDKVDYRDLKRSDFDGFDESGDFNDDDYALPNKKKIRLNDYDLQTVTSTTCSEQSNNFQKQGQFTQNLNSTKAGNKKGVIEEIFEGSVSDRKCLQMKDSESLNNSIFPSQFMNFKSSANYYDSNPHSLSDQKNSKNFLNDEKNNTITLPIKRDSEIKVSSSTNDLIQKIRQGRPLNASNTKRDPTSFAIVNPKARIDLNLIKTKKDTEGLNELNLKNRFSEPKNRVSLTKKTDDLIKKIKSKGKSSLAKKSLIEEIQREKSLVNSTNIVKNFELKENSVTRETTLNEDDEEKTINKILSTPSMKEKYLEVTKPGSFLQLPAAFNRLFNIFKQIDQIIVLFQQKSHPTFWVNVQTQVVKLLQIRISIQDFQRVLSVFPDCYKVELITNEKSHNLEFYITFPEDDYKTKNTSSESYLNQRKCHFREKLINIVTEHHNGWLKENKFKAHNPEQHSTWHVGFDLHSLKDEIILLNDLPIKRQEVTMTIKQFLQNKDNSLDDSVKKTMEAAEKKFPNFIPYKPTDSKQEETQTLKQKLINIIKQKEKALAEKINEEKLAKESGANFSNNTKELKLIAQCLKMHYASRQVSNMFIVKVIDF